MPSDASLPLQLKPEALIAQLSGDVADEGQAEEQQPLKILMLEDNPVDAELMTRELAKAGVDFTAKRVDTRAGFAEALEAFAPNVVLLDCKLPGYDSAEALAHERRVHPEIPVVIVTGTIGDEAAVELLKAGAKDYVLKSNLVRLAPAVERVISVERGIRARKAAERAVRESEAKFRSVVEQNVAGIAIIRDDGAIAYVNPYFARLVASTPLELIGRPLLDLVPEDEKAAVVQQLGEQLSSEVPFVQRQSAICAKDGRRIEVLINASRSTFEGRLASIAVVIDITERKAAEAALYESRRITVGILNSIPVRVFWKDKNLRFLGCNAAFARDAGFVDPKDLVGKDDFQMGWRDQAESYRAHDRGVIETGCPEFLIEESRTTPTGETLTVLTSKIPLRSATGETEGVLGTYMDITDRKRAEQALLEEEAKFRGLVEQEIAGIYIVAADGTLAYVNPYFAKIFGYEPDEVIGRPVLDFFPDSEKETVRQGIAAQISGREASVQIVTKLLRKDGTPLDVLVHGARATYQGAPASVGVVLDISGRKRAEETIRENEAKFRSLVEQNVAGIFIIRDDGTIGYVNPNFASILGAEPSDLIGHPLLDFIPEDKKTDVRDQLGEHLSGPLSGGGALMQRESFMRTLDGRTIEVLVNASRSIFEGRPASLAVVLDITESNKAQRELAANAAILATEHELSPDGILVIDTAAKIISVNHRLIDIFGIPPRLIDDKRDEPVLEWVTSQVADSAAFLARVRYLYDHPQESSQEEIVLTDGRVLDRHTAPMMGSNGGCFGRIWFFRDITGQRATERALQRLNRTLKTLSAGNEVLVRATSEQELLNEMCRVIVETGSYRMAWIGVPQLDAAKSLMPVAWAGEVGKYLDNARLTWADEPNGGPHARAIRRGEPQVVQNLAEERSKAPWQEWAVASGFASSVVFPLKDASGVFAILAIDAAETDAFNADELKLLQELANDLAFGIRSQREHTAREALDQRWRASLEATIGAIASTVEMRDPYTAGHQQRVARLATAIARRLSMSEHDIHGIYLAGIIHDVGKINIPAEILNRPGKLSKLEFQLIQTHAQSGYDIVKGVDFPWPIAQMVLQHHERLDGSGYPQGIKGDVMLREAKILAIADVVEAMMSHRPYRPALGIDAALAEIEKGKGTLFDPQTVEACVALFREDNFHFD